MRHIVTPEQVLAAAQLPTITFLQIPRNAVKVSDVASMSNAERAEILERYYGHGFAVVQVGTEPTLLRVLADSLGLGEPFVPPLYSSGGYTALAVTRISANGTSETIHPSFERTVHLDLHCDGTLQTIGYVKTSILLCQSPAAGGGDTTLFNSSAAYAELASSDARAAAALATDGVLIRRATVNGRSDVNVGPAFTVEDGRLVCGYSVSDTDRWALPDGVEAADLERAVQAMKRASEPGSQHFTQVTLAAGQAIILDNTRLSHGRTAYRDSESSHRCLYRGLFLCHPIAVAEGTETQGRTGCGALEMSG